MTHTAVTSEALNRQLHQPTAKHPKHFKGSLAKVLPSDFDALASEWSVLTHKEPNAQPFFQPYWFKSFCKTFHKGNPAELITVRDESRLRGVLPLMRQNHFLGSIPAKTLRSLSGIHSCRFDFICSTEERESVALAAWHTLKENTAWTVIEALNVPEGGAFESIMQHAQKDGYLIGRWPTLLSPYLRVPKPGSNPLSNCPDRYKADRKRLDRYQRKLDQLGESAFEVVTSFDEKLFQEFLELEGGGWKGQSGGAIKCSPVVTDFYREVMSQAAAAGHLRMCTLKLGEERIAMELTFITGNRCYSPKIAYDERFSNCAPGQLITRHAIKDLVERETTVYDLLGARARHKLLWAGEIQPHANCYIFRPSLHGRLCHLACTRIGPQIKKMKYSWYGDPQSIPERKAEKKD